MPRNAHGRHHDGVLRTQAFRGPPKAATGSVVADAGRPLRDEVVHYRPGGPLDCSDGQVLHDWCLRGWGIAWRSTWEVEADLQAGRLVEVLGEYAAPPNGIYAVFPQRKHLPVRVRLWIDFLKQHFSQPDFWRDGASSHP